MALVGHFQHHEPRTEPGWHCHQQRADADLVQRLRFLAHLLYLGLAAIVVLAAGC